MYLPAPFAVTDPAPLHALLRAFPLATWSTVVDGQPCVNHIPFLLDAEAGEHGTLIGHVARANPVWRTPAPSIFVFQGPQAYVSPSWYPSKQEHGKAVPTWNYAVVHAHGRPEIVEDRQALRAILERQTQAHETGLPHPWSIADAPAEFIEQLLGAIVGIHVPVTRWEAKFKLSQNRSAADRAGVIAALGAAHPMAQAMTQAGGGKPT
ncbi:MAG TPA: FMN-binding negative transcriptional regulator [Rubrivivax sp.]|nr:FMN-binding negative transcriptional regulator [Burkholderiales bacterium]HNT40141.1 FMN-binding negative transcriptional regulator [Rubrivivax sp.]